MEGEQIQEVTQETNTTTGTPAPAAEMSDSDLESALEAALQPSDLESPQATSEDTEAPQQEQKVDPAQAKDEQITLSRQEYEKLQKQIQDKQRFIEQRSQVIGDLRRKLKQAIEEKEKQIDEVYLESPRQALKLQEEVKDAKQQDQQLEAEEQGMKVRANNERVFFSFVHPQDVVMDEYVELLKADNYPPEYIERFKQDPFGTADAGEMIQLSRRWKAERYFAALLEKHKEVLAELGKLRNKPREVLSNIESALKRPPTMTASDGGAAKAQARMSFDPHRLSDAELEEALKNASVRDI